MTAGNLRDMADATSSSITIAAPPERVMAVIADFAAYPEWAEQINAVEVLAPGSEGRAERVRRLFAEAPESARRQFQITTDADGETHFAWQRVILRATRPNE